jgi:clan AA aspartic protease
MIIGIVNHHLEALINLIVHGPHEQEREIEAVIDTGFSSHLSLPPVIISMLGLPFRMRDRAILADGNESVFDIYQGTVLWDGQFKSIAIHESDTDPLVGMSLLYGNSLSMQIVEGGSVIINALPQEKPMS